MEAKGEDNGWDELELHDIHRTILSNNVETLQSLLNNKMDPDLRTRDGTNSTPLHLWAKNGGSVECLRILLQAKADINVVNFNNATPLTQAIFRGDADKVDLLIEKKASINVTDRHRYLLCFIFHRAGGDTTRIIQTLLEGGITFWPQANEWIEKQYSHTIYADLSRREYKFRACEFGFN